MSGMIYPNIRVKLAPKKFKCLWKKNKANTTLLIMLLLLLALPIHSPTTLSHSLTTHFSSILYHSIPLSVHLTFKKLVFVTIMSLLVQSQNQSPNQISWDRNREIPKWLRKVLPKTKVLCFGTRGFICLFLF